jgi:crotonobetainyl-CoA:carnitine CoA-transferase CaiB-like acyl-CoA transferase
MPGRSSGYRAIDLTAMISGPLATMILADHDAKIRAVIRFAPT